MLRQLREQNEGERRRMLHGVQNAAERIEQSRLVARERVAALAARQESAREARRRKAEAEFWRHEAHESRVADHVQTHLQGLGGGGGGGVRLQNSASAVR